MILNVLDTISTYTVIACTHPSHHSHELGIAKVIVITKAIETRLWISISIYIDSDINIDSDSNLDSDSDSHS